MGLGRVGEQYEGRVGLRRLGKLWGRGGPGESWGAVGKGGVGLGRVREGECDQNTLHTILKELIKLFSKFSSDRTWRTGENPL